MSRQTVTILVIMLLHIYRISYHAIAYLLYSFLCYCISVGVTWTFCNKSLDSGTNSYRSSLSYSIVADSEIESRHELSKNNSKNSRNDVWSAIRS